MIERSPIPPQLSHLNQLDGGLKAVVRDGLSLAGGWREAIVELEDFCSEPVRLKNMLAAADQLDRWIKQARAALGQDDPNRSG